MHFSRWLLLRRGIFKRNRSNSLSVIDIRRINKTSDSLSRVNDYTASDTQGVARTLALLSASMSRPVGSTTTIVALNPMPFGYDS